MIMRICLVNSPSILPQALGAIEIYQPLGLAYIATVLEKEGFEVKILDALALGWRNIHKIRDKMRVGLELEDIMNYVKDYSPDIVGITIPFSSQARSAFEVAEACKKLDPRIITIAGGAHPSARPVDTLMGHAIDIAVIGEGELTMLELAQLLEKSRNDYVNVVRKVRGIAFSKGDQIELTDPRPLNEDLDSIPFPARHLLPMKEYFDAARHFLASRGRKKRWATMITSRGCPYNCVFCSIHTVWGRRWRARSPENVVEEIRNLVESYAVEEIDFEDDNLTLNRKRMEKICDLIHREKIDIDWRTPNGVRVDTLDEEISRKMKESGCKEIMIGVESGDQNVLDAIIKKNIDLNQVEEVVKIAKKAGIEVGCFFVIGLIGETKQNIENTINFARKLKRLGADSFWFSIATPYYGTDLYEQAEKGGYLTMQTDDMFCYEAIIGTPEFTPEELLSIRRKAMMKLNGNYYIKYAIKNPIRALRYLSLIIKVRTTRF